MLFLNYSFTSLCFRFNLSCVFYFCSAYLFSVKKNFLGRLLLLVAVFNHISFLLFAIPLLFSLYYNRFGNKRLLLVLIILILTFSGDFLNLFLKNLDFQNRLIEHALYYTDGVWAGDFVEDHSLGYLIKLYLDRVPFFMSCIVAYKIFRKNKLASLISFLLILTVITAPYLTLKIRCQTVLILPLLFYIIRYLPESKTINCRFAVYMLLISGLIFSGSDLRGKRRELSISKIDALFTQDAFSILSNQYDRHWIETHVNEDGSPANINY